MSCLGSHPKSSAPPKKFDDGFIRGEESKKKKDYKDELVEKAIPEKHIVLRSHSQTRHPSFCTSPPLSLQSASQANHPTISYTTGGQDLCA